VSETETRRYYQCYKCGTIGYTIDGSKPNSMCLAPASYRISGICGGGYDTEVTEADFEKQVKELQEKSDK